MRRLLLLLAALAIALVAAGTAAAHPLGNFTINRYTELDVSGNRLYALYVLDMAEIPTFQAEHAGGIHAGEYARRIASNLQLTIDGRHVRLVPVKRALAFPRGAGGLHTTRLEIVLAGPALHGTARLAYRDLNYRDRLGWKEVVVRGLAGARVVSSTAPSKSVSDQLRAYPKSLLQSPLDVDAATAAVAPGSAVGPPPALTPGPALQAPDRVADSGFASLITQHDLSVGFVLVSLFLAFFWGAAHALSPGHGKSIVAAYLVGSKGTARHAALLGLTVTVTHTIGVFALGLITLSLSEFIVPDTLYPWLNLVSALLIVAVGLSVLRWRVREWRRGSHRHHHHHGHDHHHGHGHDHQHDPALSLRRLLGVGISGGIIPCPTALVVLLAAISLHRVGYGLVLILSFSVGLAAAMTGIGLLAVGAKRVFRRVDFERGSMKLLPAVSALVVLGLGVAMTVRALPKIA
jgi:ABC-type nickel/cobalt efflux system permease component RcnA